MTFSTNKESGFSLLEVLISFVIILVSVVSLVGLYRYYITSESDSLVRNNAFLLMETKLDDLRTFDSIDDYNKIANDQGGRILAGDKKEYGGYFYSLHWTATDNLFSGSIVNSKNITVKVSWSSSNGNTQLFELNSIISRFFPADQKQLTLNSKSSSQMPKVPYSPGAVPDVVSITIDSQNNIKQETTKPLPAVENKEGSIQTQFETITYDSSSTTQVKSDFKTISCSCTTNGTADTLLPAYPYMTDSNYLYWRIGDLATKNIGAVADNKQPDLCNVCCLNHFDGDNASFINYFNQLNKNAKKYNYTWSSSSDFVSSGTYVDSCRLLRLDGYYKPMPDWNLIKLVVMSSAFLTDTNNVTIYQNYIKEVVKEYIDSLKSGNPFSPQEFSAYAGGNGTNVYMKVGDTPIQLIARGIFVDILSPNSTSYSSPSQLSLSDINTGDNNFLTKVPFYDINMTLLSQWSSGNANIAGVSNESIKSLSSTDSNYYGVYRRGYVTPIATTTDAGIAITASAYQGNSSVAAYQYSSSLPEKAVSPFERNNGKSGSLNVVIGNSNDPSKVSIIGKIYCYDQTTTGNDKNIKTSIVDCKQNNTNKLTEIAIAGTGAACQLETVKNETSYLLYNCQVTPEVPATVTITSVPSGFAENPTSVNLIYHTATPDTVGGCFNVYNQNISLSSVPQTCPHNP
nr:prepilin-type N-terminal cleavage/methylation domain-containing protein [uncultured Tolumonas sp.]